MSMMPRMPKHDWPLELCTRCGKTPRADATGYCWDCADTLALHGLMVPLPGQHADKAAAEAEPESRADDETP
jgi:hypothetical protein